MQRELFGGAMTAIMPEAFKDARYLLLFFFFLDLKIWIINKGNVERYLFIFYKVLILI